MASTSAGPPGVVPDGDLDRGSRPELPARPWPAQLGGLAARPQLIRALNEQLLLSHIRQLGPCSPADLARISGLSKPTVSLALGNVERSGLVRAAGQRTGVPGRPATLYEIRPEAGFVLGLDVGHQYLRGALADMTGEIRTKLSARTRATSVRGLLAELVRLADTLSAGAGLNRSDITQTVIGSPGVYDPRRDAIALTGGLAGWNRPAALAGLRAEFGPEVVMENDVDAAALAEQAHGHGREFASFAFVWIGTGVGMGLVLDGRLHRGAHGVAGEIAFMPISDGQGADPEDARKRGVLEASGSAAAVVRAARRAGLRGPVSARRVFAAAAAGDDARGGGGGRRGAPGRQGDQRGGDGRRSRTGGARRRHRPGTRFRHGGHRGTASARAGHARGQGERAGHRRRRRRLPGLRG